MKSKAFYAPKLHNFFGIQERIPVDDVFRILISSKGGLASDEAERRLAVFGQNKLEEKKANFLILLLFVSSFALW